MTPEPRGAGKCLSRQVSVIRTRIRVAAVALNNIYRIEAELRRKDNETEKEHPERIQTARDKKPRSLTDDIEALMKEISGKNKIKIGPNNGRQRDDAIKTAVTCDENRSREMRNPTIPSDTNPCEREIRPLTVSRRMSDFKQSQEYTDGMCA